MLRTSHATFANTHHRYRNVRTVRTDFAEHILRFSTHELFSRIIRAHVMLFILFGLGTALAEHPDVYASGASLYRWHCAVCHGETGAGLAEAKLLFPPGDRACTRCHKTGNPVVMPLEQMLGENQMFPIGDPSPLSLLHGSNGLPAFPSGEALFQYVRATMPRYYPNSLTENEYRQITYFLLTGFNERGEDAEAFLPTIDLDDLAEIHDL